MKAILLALLMVGCGEEAVDASKLQDRNGTAYLPNGEPPFTGRAEGFYDNGQKSVEESFKDGKKDGLETKWYENGQKMLEGTYKDGEPVLD